MKIKLSFCRGLLLLVSLTSAVGAQDQPSRALFTDSFTGKLAEGWTWVRPVEGARTVAEDGLRLRSLPGTLWLRGNNATNLLLRPLPVTNAYAVSVTVTSDPKRNGEQGGLLLYVDDDNYIKVIREFYQGQLQLIFAREEEGKGVGIRYLPNAQNPVVLRLVVKGKVVTASYRSPDSREWTDLGTCETLRQVPQAGLFTHGGDAQSDRQARFNKFEIHAIEE